MHAFWGGRVRAVDGSAARDIHGALPQWSWSAATPPQAWPLQPSAAAYAALHVDKVVRLVEGAKALGDLLALRGETLGCLARRVYVLLSLLHARGSLWGATWAALVRRLISGVARSAYSRLSASAAL